MKYTGPKAKRCRRQGTNLYGSDKYDKILQRKPHGPGKSPKARQGKRSEFGTQLLEKQKVRDIYGLSEKQFHRVYVEASRLPGQTGDTMKQLLERRLDNTVYRAGFAMTRLQSRQFVSHGLFYVDGRRVKTPSYLVKPGQKITVRPQAKQSAVWSNIQSAHEKYATPNWLKADTNSISAEVMSLPTADHAEQGLGLQQVIEFYSR